MKRRRADSASSTCKSSSSLSVLVVLVVLVINGDGRGLAHGRRRVVPSAAREWDASMPMTAPASLRRRTPRAESRPRHLFHVDAPRPSSGRATLFRLSDSGPTAASTPAAGLRASTTRPTKRPASVTDDAPSADAPSAPTTAPPFRGARKSCAARQTRRSTPRLRVRSVCRFDVDNLGRSSSFLFFVPRGAPKRDPSRGGTIDELGTPAGRMLLTCLRASRPLPCRARRRAPGASSRLHRYGGPTSRRGAGLRREAPERVRVAYCQGRRPARLRRDLAYLTTTGAVRRVDFTGGRSRGWAVARGVRRRRGDGVADALCTGGALGYDEESVSTRRLCDGGGSCCREWRCAAASCGRAWPCPRPDERCDSECGEPGARAAARDTKAINTQYRHGPCRHTTRLFQAQVPSDSRRATSEASARRRRCASHETPVLHRGLGVAVVGRANDGRRLTVRG